MMKFEKYFSKIDALKKPPQLRDPLHGLPTRKHIPGIKNIICVASGKGGVGKSTTSGTKTTSKSNRV